MRMLPSKLPPGAPGVRLFAWQVCLYGNKQLQQWFTHMCCDLERRDPCC